jgi:cysteine desulfurase/selenocysteine lyase
VDSLAPRDDFPVLEKVAYLNAASISLVPVPVQRDVREFDEAVSYAGTVNFDDEAENRVYEGVRQAAGELIHANPVDVAVMTSATEALCSLAWWLRPGEGSNIVSIDLEFPSVTYPWIRIAEDFGAEVRLVRAKDEPASLTFHDLVRAVDERTAVICVSHVEYASGHLFDIGELSKLARAYGSFLIIDATQSAGVAPIDLRQYDVDVLLSSAYKWLCGLCGAAFCYLKPEVSERFRPPLVGWRTTGEGALSFDATAITLSPGGRRMEYGTVAYGAGIALGSAIRYLLGFGVDRILAHSQALGALLIDGLDSLGAELITPRDHDRRGGIVAARFAGHQADDVAGLLADEGVHVASRQGNVRFSPHLYSNSDDIYRALEALERSLTR